MTDARELAVFALGSSVELGTAVAERLGIRLAPVEERDFEDGEHKTRPLTSVRDRDVYVISSLYGEPSRSVNDKLCRLWFFSSALKDASAARVTAVVPYLAYARKDRRSQPRDPVTTRYVATHFEATGVDRLVTVDAHNVAAFQNAFRCLTEHLDTRRLFARHFASLARDEPVVLVSPDAGGVKRAERLRETLSLLSRRPIPLAFLEKSRSGGEVHGGEVVGEVRGRVAVVLDDLISTGTTLLRAADACRRKGARAVHAAATHGLFVDGASRVVSNPTLDRITVTNTVAPLRLDDEARRRLTVLDVAPLFAEAIRRLHEGESLVELLEP